MSTAALAAATLRFSLEDHGPFVASGLLDSVSAILTASHVSKQLVVCVVVPLQGSPVCARPPPPCMRVCGVARPAVTVARALVARDAVRGVWVGRVVA